MDRGTKREGDEGDDSRWDHESKDKYEVGLRRTLKQTQRLKGRVTRTMSQERMRITRQI